MKMESDNTCYVRIRRAVKNDARYISAAVIEAVGEEITLGFAGSRDRVPLIHDLFRQLAEADDSQYSYLNSLIAETDGGTVAGVIIAYDGENLHRLRRRFIERANAVLGYDIKEEEMHDEASPDEIYLDSLCVFEPFRHRGIGSELIIAAVEANACLGKPFGLLVDKDNSRARTLYEKLGFRKVGETPFASTVMDHLQLVR